MTNVLSTFILSFKRIKGLHANENRSRLYNSYESLLDLTVCVLNYAIFSATNQMILIHLFLITTLIGLSGNYIVHVSLALRFIYSSLLNFTAVLIITLLNFFVFIRMLNLNKICDVFKSHHERVPSMDNESIIICEGQRVYYIMWMILELVIVFAKFVGIFYAYKANIVIKNIKKLKKNKIVKQKIESNINRVKPILKTE